jgi:hypothetical protein
MLIYLVGAAGFEPMYEVSTQEISSCEADMLPWMWGRETLTIVVSSPCMTQAQMTVAVIAGRLMPGIESTPFTARALVVLLFACHLPAGENLSALI